MSELALVDRSSTAPGQRPLLEDAIDLGLLQSRGLDTSTWVFAPRADDPSFGFSVCERVECERGTAWPTDRLCHPCKASAGRSELSLEEFVLSPPERQSYRLCLVCHTPGFERPARQNGLCTSCDARRQAWALTVDEFVDGIPGRIEPAQPRPSFGRCAVPRCPRFSHGRVGLCYPHTQLWIRRGKPAPERYSELRFRLTTGREVDLNELRPRVLSQLLAVLTLFARTGRPISPYDLELVVAKLYDLDDFTDCRWSGAAGRFAKWAKRLTALDGRSIETERSRDVWDLGVVDPVRTARIDFTAIPQRWLREATKDLVYRHLGLRADDTLGRWLRGSEQLGASLARRADRGEEPAALGRADLEAFLRRLGQLCTAGTISRHQREALVIAVRMLLDHVHATGMSEPGGCAGGLPPTVRLDRYDVPKAPARDNEDPGKALPESVIAQLLSPDRLEVLRAYSPSSADAAVLLIHTGRRPSEILALTCDCLAWDEPAQDGGRPQPVLRYRREKPPRKQLNLPIHTHTAELLEVMIARRRQQHPTTAPGKLALFPALYSNREGRKALPMGTFKSAFEKWRSALTDLRTGDGRSVPPEDVYPYAFRHSFAQRHADAGVRQDVLQLLMDHRSSDTTAVYYRVRREQKRAAIELTANLAVDRDGRQVQSVLAQFLDAEDLRREIGTIPVPLGHCIEPRNVRALGRSCEFRYRCTGCVHFRTDPSRLDDLRAHLEELLASREHLASALPDLADWARRDALPDENEIRTLRKLIRANETLLDDLDPDQHRLLENYLTELRRQRLLTRDALPITMVAGVATPETNLVPPPTAP